MIPTRGMKKNEDLDQKIYKGDIQQNDQSKILHKKIILLLHASYDCNANCIYCINKNLRTQYKNIVMDEKLIPEIIEKLGKHLRELTWHGGEPLLLPNNLFIRVEEEKQKRGFRFPTVLQTNGIALTKEKREFLNYLNINIGTSFDGLYNDISRGKESTEKFLNDKLYEENSFISVTYNNTIDTLIDNYEYYKSLGVKEFRNSLVKEIIFNDKNPLIIKNDKAIENVLNYIQYWVYDKNSPIVDQYITLQIQRVCGQTMICDHGNCIGGWLMINPYGDIGFCGNYDNFIVNIKDINSYEDLIELPEYKKRIDQQIKLMNSCQNCPWFHVCYGGCMALNYAQDPNYSTINQRCCEYDKNLLTGIYELIKDIDISKTDLYNPLFIKLLKELNYYSLSEIKEIERKYNNG